MDVRDGDVAEFQALYEAKFGIKLDYIEARAKLTLLVRQIEIVYQPVTQAQVDAIIE